MWSSSHQVPESRILQVFWQLAAGINRWILGRFLDQTKCIQWEFQDPKMELLCHIGPYFDCYSFPMMYGISVYTHIGHGHGHMTAMAFAENSSAHPWLRSDHSFHVWGLKYTETRQIQTKRYLAKTTHQPSWINHTIIIKYHNLLIFVALYVPLT